MDTRQADHHLGTGAGSARRRGLLFAALVVLGLGYVAAFWFFLANSVDFVARQTRDAALAAAAGLAIEPPASLRFGSGDVGASLLGEGWHRPESNGTWSRDREAVIHLPAAARTARGLALELEAYVDPDRGELLVELELDGEPLGSWRATTAAAVVRARVPMPASSAAAAPPVLRLRIDRPSSPLRNGAGARSDSRMLGVQLRRLELDRSDHAAPQP
jgi:hypothetical protein